MMYSHNYNAVPLFKNTMESVLEKPLIFIVDDEQGVAEMCADYLKPAYQVQVYYSAKDALTAFDKNSPPDVLITDIKMPGIDGTELAQRLSSEHVPTRIIMISAYAEKDNALKAIEYGVAGFIEKPFEPATLKALIAKTLAKSRISLLTEKAMVIYWKILEIQEKLVQEYRDQLLATENILYQHGLRMEPGVAVQRLKESRNQVKSEETVHELLVELGGILN